jgi:hypothetical protein
MLITIALEVLILFLALTGEIPFWTGLLLWLVAPFIVSIIMSAIGALFGRNR